MRTLRTSLFLVSLAVLSLASVQAVAHGLFTGDNNCNQCHTTFTMGGAQHSVHTSLTDCATCHASDPVAVNACLTCHDAPDMFVLHGSLVYGDPQVQCGYCHEGVASEARTWSSLKNIFE